MAAGERNSMQCKPPVAVPVARPAAIADLERRVDEALATARASEAAIMTVGAAAFDAAEQAHRAAELAERASAFAATLAGNTGPAREPLLPLRPIGAAGPPPGPATASTMLPPEPSMGEITISAAPPAVAAPTAGAPLGLVAGDIQAAEPTSTSTDLQDERLRSFHLRADRLSSRLRALV